MLSYSLKITKVKVSEVDGISDVVVSAHWAYTGTDGEKSVDFGGETEIKFAPGGDFIAYENLDNDTIAGWVLSSWSPQYKQIVEDAIVSQFAIKDKPLPWSDPPVGPTDADLNPPAEEE